MIAERLERRAQIRANSFDPESRSFEAVVSSGATVERYDFDGPYLEELALDGQEWPSSAPLLDGHNARSVSGILGRAASFRVEGGDLIANIKLSSRDELKGLASDIQAGIVDSLSIGYTVTKWKARTEGGQRYKTAAKWQLKEVSLVPIPADDGAKVRSGDMPESERQEGAENKTATRAASRRALEALAEEAGLDEAFLEEATTRGLSEREARSLAFEQLKARNTAASQVRNTRSDATLDNPTSRRDAMVESFTARMLGNAPTGAAAQITAEGVRSLSDAARAVLEASGVRTLGLQPAQMIERAFATTSDFPILLTEVSNRTLAARFELLLSPVVKLARRKSAADFRAFSEVRLGGNNRLEPLGEGGEFKQGSFTEAKESMRIASYGKRYSLSFQALANDDLGAFSQVSSDLATAAAMTANDLVLDLIAANPKLGDNKAVFHVDHGNLLTTGSAISDTSLETAVLAMRRQKGIAGELIRVDPKVLIVAPEKEVAARRLLASVAATQADKINPWAGAFSLIVEPRFEGAGWHLVDPALGDLVDAYLSGFEGPRVETQQSWESLGTEWRVHMHYGVAFLGFRGWLKATGAA